MDNIQIVKVQWERYTEIIITCFCIKIYCKITVKSWNLHGPNFHGLKRCKIVIGFGGI